jgi:acetyl esterase/lipase
MRPKAIAIISGTGIIAASILLAALAWRSHLPPRPAMVSGAVPDADLPKARATFRTHLRRTGPSPQDYEPLSPPVGVHEVLYPSGSLRLKAWLTDDPGDGKKHEAVVFLHGGFVFGRDSNGDDWADQAAVYAHGGFTVMALMLRGENGNPGTFELWYGEVDDTVAAGRYLADVPYVDPSRVFVAGHSVGGTLAQLAAEVDSPFKATASFSGRTDLLDWAQAPKGYPWAPFDPADVAELRIRSPLHFVNSLRCPAYLYFGSEEPDLGRAARRFVDAAKRSGKVAIVTEEPGDHMSSVPAGIRDSIARFRNVAPTRPANATPP